MLGIDRRDILPRASVLSTVLPYWKLLGSTDPAIYNTLIWMTRPTVLQETTPNQKSVLRENTLEREMISYRGELRTKR